MKTTEDVFGLGVICMWKPMVRSRDSEAVPETRGAPVDRQRQFLIRHYNRTGEYYIYILCIFPHTLRIN